MTLNRPHNSPWLSSSADQTSLPGIRTIIVDVRCLQDENFARRGIGRHALALLRAAPRERGGIRLVGLVDPGLPPLLDAAREALDHVERNVYAALRKAPDAFISFSPMTHDPLFVARLVGDTQVLRAAVVHDFIPHRWPERYLPGPTQRLRYAASLQWLTRHDLFAPNSQATADDVIALLGISADRVTITGCALDPAFEGAQEPIRQLQPRHILVIGGGDPRKNPEVVIRAHARSPVLQGGAGVLLVIGGSYVPAEAASFRALAASLGGRPDLLKVPGQVSDADLIGMYGHAQAIICPSRDEGFSLPIIEGMAAGVPCLASDIPAHRELVNDPAWRFAPDDDDRLMASLQRVIEDGAWREAALRRQATLWPRFRACEVAERFWRIIQRGLEARQQWIGGAPSIVRGARPRVALLSPVPPDRSGVADYTAAKCLELGKLVDLHVFTQATQPAALPGAASVRPLSALPHLMSRFDRVVDVIGNSHFHLKIFELLRRYGGACIAHDARMLGFYRILLGSDRALAVASKELQRPVEEAELDKWMSDEGCLEALFLSEIAESASPLIVHSLTTARLISERYDVTPTYLPFCVQRPWTASVLSPAARASARRRLGIPDDEVVVATFGSVHGSKAPEECIQALEVLRGWGIPASLHFVGTITPQNGAGLSALASRCGVSAHVRFMEDYVSEQSYGDYLTGADLAVQLRTYGFGSTSGALSDCVVAGLPVVANVGLADAVGVPATYMRSIPDAVSPFLVAEGLIELLEAGARPGVARQREAERQAYCEERSFANYARSLCQALQLDVCCTAER